MTRDFSKSPQAEVVIDVDQQLAPERPTACVPRAARVVVAQQGSRAAVDTCKKRVEGPRLG